MLKIGDFSRIAQVSIKTLRYYDRLGLLKPAWIDRFSGYRYYTVEQLPRLNRILALKDLGFSLEQIGKLLKDDLSAIELRGMMKFKHAELEREIQEEQARMARVEARLRQIDREGSIPLYDMVLKCVPPQQVVGIRDVICDSSYLKNLFDVIRADLRDQNVSLETSWPLQAVHYDSEYHDQGVDVEVTAPIMRSLPELSGLRIHELPGVNTMASVVHQGSYGRLNEAYTALMTWVEASGYRVKGPSRNVFLETSDEGIEATCNITEVQFPVQKKPTLFFVSGNKEKRKMEPKIVEKPAFSVVGRRYQGKNENNEIAQMWGEFIPRIKEIQNIVDDSFGLCKPADENGVFEYLAGMEVSSTEDIPDGMESWEVTAGKYAVFPCTLKTIGETYKYAFETWLPGSDYEYMQGIDFEFYDEDFDADVEDSTLYIYIPIK